ncbi:MAG: hypothetical protein LBM07_03240 [Culturomica sp.]|jgi:hypothetical protein|nr:hypothetical protein [Culturomica sp.]
MISCNREKFTDELPEKEAKLLIATRAQNYDSNELPEEYALNNLSIFLTDTSSNIITHKFVYVPYSSVDGELPTESKLVTLPIDVSILTVKDVYVIANCDNEAAFNAVKTLDDLQALKTKKLVYPTMINTTRGLPMYGELGKVDFRKSIEIPQCIYLNRICSKIRVRLYFADAGWIGLRPNFILENVASFGNYSPVPAKAGENDLVNYPAIYFEMISQQEYAGIAYIYESSVAPQLRLRFVLNGVEKEYVTDPGFPVPVRNYLYDIELTVYKPKQSASSAVQKDYALKFAFIN